MFNLIITRSMDYYKNVDHLAQEDQYKPQLQGLQYQRVPETPKAASAISLTLLKQHARIDFDTDDTLLQVYLEASIRYLEEWSQRSLQNRIWRVTALRMPCNFRLAYGPVQNIVTTGFTNQGDILLEGGENVDVTYTSLGLGDDPAVQVAIARYATGMYIIRENIIDTKLQAGEMQDQAKAILQPYKMATMF